MKVGWEIKKLGEVCSVAAGQGAPQGDANYCLDGIPFIKAGNLEDLVNGLPELEVQKVSDEVAKQHRLKIYKAGSVVFAKSGMSCMKGHVYSLRADCYVVSHLAILTPHGISTAFLKYILTFHRPNTLVKDSAYPSISLEDIKAFPIPVPSLNEQEKIVAELDCLSGIIEKKKQQLKELDALAQSIFYEMFGNSCESIPVSYYITGLSAGKSLAGDEECPNKVLKTGAVTYDHFDGNQVKNLPLEYVPIPSHKVNVNDLLISRMNTAELVGACAYVWWVDDSIYLPDRLWRAEINKLCHPVYLWKALTTDKAKEQIRNYASGTSGSMKNISKSSFLNVQIPKAPLIEQQLFASKIEAIEKQKELIKQSIQETETLFNSRMDYYFN